MSASAPLAVRVWGDLACFTRPELKVERVSYEVMTPSAARGVLEAIFWKPEISWRIQRIIVLTPIRHFSVLRNEVNDKASPDTISGWMAANEHRSYFADEHRAQRHTLALRDVAYRIEAQMVLKSPVPEGIGKYVAQFQRRVQKGQCYIRPCLGCREFPAHFGEAKADELPVGMSCDLGQMLLDLRYNSVQGRAEPVFFSARLADGVVEVPQSLYEELPR